MVEQIVAELVLHAPRGADQDMRMVVEEEPLQRDRQQDEPGVLRQRDTCHARLHVVHRLADEPRHPHLEQRGEHHRDATDNQRGGMAAEVGNQMAE